MKTKEASPASGNWTNAPDKVYLSSCMRSDFIKAATNGHTGDIEYIRKDSLLEWIKFAYGKVSMNPLDCSEAFEELINKVNSL